VANIDKQVEKAKELGYEVDLAFETLEGVQVYNVKGQGVETQYTSEQDDTWNFLTDPKAHEHRSNMFKHNDEEDEFTMTEEEIFESSIAASLSSGLLSEEQANEMREKRKVVISQ
jgi:hypothetical protein